MNRNRYLPSGSDPIDQAIIAILAINGRITVRELAQAVGMSAPCTAERMHRLEDRGVIEGYTIIINEMMLGMVIGAHIRLKPFPGEVSRVAAMLAEAPEIIEADRVTGDECFVAKTAVPDMRALEKLIDRFLPFADANAAVIQSTSVKRRIPKI